MARSVSSTIYIHVHMYLYLLYLLYSAKNINHISSATKSES